MMFCPYNLGGLGLRLLAKLLQQVKELGLGHLTLEQTPLGVVDNGLLNLLRLFGLDSCDVSDCAK